VRIQIPSYPAGMNLSRLLGQMFEIRRSSEKLIELDFDALIFIRPEAVVSLSNMIRLLQTEGKRVTPIINGNDIRNDKNPVKYLDDCLFFQKHFGQKLMPGDSQRLTNGLELINPIQFPQAYIIETVKWLQYGLGFKKKRFTELSTSLGEVLNNIRDHSCAEVASCFAQHYPQKQEIRFAISDFGLGIPTTIRKVLPQAVSDYEAIKQATLPKISSRTTPGNAGIGLSNIISFIEQNDGRLIIDSGSGRFIAANNKQHACVSSVGNYPGTLIIMVFRTDTIMDEEEGFDWSSM